MWRLWEPLEATVRASSSATSKASVEPSKAKDRGGKQANSETKEKDDKTKVVNSTDVIVTQEEPEKTVFIGAEVVTNASAVDAVRNILSTVEVSMPSPIVAPRKSFTNFSGTETGGGKVVSKKHLNPDEVEAVPEFMEKEATESHDDRKAMEVGSPVLGPSEKVKSSEETVNVDKDDSTEDKADTRPRPTTQTKVIDTIKDDSSTTATATKAKVVSSADDKIEKEEETSERTTRTNAREDPELENFEGLRFIKN